MIKLFINTHIDMYIHSNKKKILPIIVLSVVFPHPGFSQCHVIQLYKD